MYCNHCGAQMDDNAVFCTSCGEKLYHSDQEIERVKHEEPFIEQPAKSSPKVTVDVERTISIAQMYGFESQQPDTQFKIDYPPEETANSDVGTTVQDNGTTVLDKGTTVLTDEEKEGSPVVYIPNAGAQSGTSTSTSAQQKPYDNAWKPQPAPQQTLLHQPENQQTLPQYQAPQTTFTPQYQPSQNGYNTNYVNTYKSVPKLSNSVSFGKAVQLFFENYVNFTGRASKSEYWWGFLFTFLMSLTIIGGIACYIGMLSLTIRRLHDIGKSWPWIFMGLVPYAGFIILIVYYCKDSVGDNQWGPGPKLN